MKSVRQYEASWIEAPAIRFQDLDKACKQVYVWIVTEDKRVVIVSKDGERWQLPGGKPEPDETLTETAVREVREETRLDIGQWSDALQFFGYQLIEDVESKGLPYLQVRYLLRLRVESSALELGVQDEDEQQPEKDIVRFVGAVSLDKVVDRIPWLESSPELATMRSLINRKV